MIEEAAQGAGVEIPEPVEEFDHGGDEAPVDELEGEPFGRGEPVVASDGVRVLDGQGDEALIHVLSEGGVGAALGVSEQQDDAEAVVDAEAQELFGHDVVAGVGGRESMLGTPRRVRTRSCTNASKRARKSSGRTTAKRVSLLSKYR